jgi:hypothetical protein
VERAAGRVVEWALEQGQREEWAAPAQAALDWGPEAAAWEAGLAHPGEEAAARVSQAQESGAAARAEALVPPWAVTVLGWEAVAPVDQELVTRERRAREGYPVDQDLSKGRCLDKRRDRAGDVETVSLPQDAVSSISFYSS